MESTTFLKLQLHQFEIKYERASLALQLGSSVQQQLHIEINGLRRQIDFVTKLLSNLSPISLNIKDYIISM
ncbi:hypothetical protein SS50377_26206 [Spironucleus salmonicida]|uniref:Uncharacterized protein n=1 Tax=Spironucleus salmonicida TaxID=348837 RepID=A0A9P8LPL6_9EUKA|nr:hypothetical protein SS50377_26206 [Spironucleus salmonicida]